MNFTKALFVSALAAGIASCVNDAEFDVGGSPAKSQLVAVEIGASEKLTSTDTRATYGEQGEFSWEAGDKIMVVYQASSTTTTTSSDGDVVYDTETEVDFTGAFTTQNTGKTASFTGSVEPFSGETTFFSYHMVGPQEDYVYFYVIDKVNGTGRTNRYYLSGYEYPSSTPEVQTNAIGLMVAQSSGATVSGDEDYNIPGFEFNQVASFFQFELKNHPTDEKITDIYLMPTSLVDSFINGGDIYEGTDATTNNVFLDNVEMSMSTGEVVYVNSYSSYIWLMIAEDYDIANNYFTMPIFPTNVADVPLSICLEVEADNGSVYIYDYDLNQGVNFKQNTIHRKSGLSWSNFDKTTVVSVSNLSDFDDSSYAPDATEWIINAEGVDTLTAANLAGLKAALSNNKYANGSIYLELSDVSIGANAFESQDGLPALGGVYLTRGASIGNSAFAGCVNLQDFTLDNATSTGSDEDASTDGNSTSTDGYTTTTIEVSLGTGIFEGCTSLASCTISTDEYPANTFKNCQSLSYINLYSVKYIGDSAFENCVMLGVSSADDTNSDGTTGSSSPSIDMRTIASIGERAFYNCDQIKIIYLYPSVGSSSDEDATDGSAQFSLGANAFHRDDTENNSSESYTSGVVLYTNSYMESNVSYKTLSVSNIAYEFDKIYINGVLQTAGDGTATGEDADVENF